MPPASAGARRRNAIELLISVPEWNARRSGGPTGPPGYASGNVSTPLSCTSNALAAIDSMVRIMHAGELTSSYTLRSLAASISSRRLWCTSPESTSTSYGALVRARQIREYSPAKSGGW